jgi:beta-glucosidase
VQVTGDPPGLSGTWSARWTGTFTPTVSGLQRFSFSGSGIARLYIDNKLVLKTASQLAIAAVDLPAGKPVSIRVEYIAHSGFAGFFPVSLKLGWSPPDPAQWQQAIDAARASDVAVVFVNDIRTEGADVPTLALPGDQDALINAVAAVNPRTVVVLDTGGPTLTPWRDRIAGLVEAWYPGQENGNAIASLLFGDTNPSGKLPVTFPAGDDQGPLTTPERFPGVGDTVRYSEGLLVGYRYYDAIGERPAYPFGYGLSYTRFAYGRVDIRRSRRADRVAVRVRVRNIGARQGAEVVQLYVGFPASAGEPPKVLKAFGKIDLAPGRSGTVALTLHRHDLAVWSEARNRWVAAGYQIRPRCGSPLPNARDQARQPPHPPSHQRDAPPSRTDRHRHDRALARPREHQDHLHLPTRQQPAQTRRDRPHRHDRHPTRPIPTTRQPHRLPRRTLIMRNRCSREPPLSREKRVPTSRHSP